MTRPLRGFLLAETSFDCVPRMSSVPKSAEALFLSLYFVSPHFKGNWVAFLGIRGPPQCLEWFVRSTPLVDDLLVYLLGKEVVSLAYFTPTIWGCLPHRCALLTAALHFLCKYVP